MPFTLAGEGVHESCSLGAFMATGKQKIFTSNKVKKRASIKLRTRSN
jgi:hypothetical protein